MLIIAGCIFAVYLGILCYSGLKVFKAHLTVFDLNLSLVNTNLDLINLTLSMIESRLAVVINPELEREKINKKISRLEVERVRLNDEMTKLAEEGGWHKKESELNA